MSQDVIPLKVAYFAINAADGLLEGLEATAAALGILLVTMIKDSPGADPMSVIEGVAATISDIARAAGIEGVTGPTLTDVRRKFGTDKEH